MNFYGTKTSCVNAFKHYWHCAKTGPVSIQTYQSFPLMEQELSEFRESDKSFEFFTVCTKLAEMAILYSKDLTTAKKSYLQ